MSSVTGRCLLESDKSRMAGVARVGVGVEATGYLRNRGKLDFSPLNKFVLREISNGTNDIFCDALGRCG